MTLTGPPSIEFKKGVLWRRPDLAELSASTGISTPMLRAQFAKSGPKWRSPVTLGLIGLYVGILLVNAPSLLGKRPAADAAEVAASATSHMDATALIGLIGLGFMVAGALVFGAGLLGNTARTQSRFIARLREGLCAKCDTCLRDVPASDSGLIICPECLNAYSESDIRFAMSGGAI